MFFLNVIPGSVTAAIKRLWLLAHAFIIGSKINESEKAVSRKQRFGQITRLRPAEGDTIVEVLIAIAVVSFVLVGAFVISNSSLRSVRDAQERGEALKLAQAQVENLKQTIDQEPDEIFGVGVSRLFCYRGSNVRVPFTAITTLNPNFQNDNFGDYPTGCREGLYYTSIEHNPNGFFTIRARWDRLGGRRNEVQLLYRIQPTAAIIPPLPTTPGPPPLPPPPTSCTTFVPTNLIKNADFSISAGPGPGVNPAAGFTTQVPNRGPNLYPDDEGRNGKHSLSGGFSVWDRGFNIIDDGHHIVGRRFPGDAAFSVPPASHYWYSNPNQAYPPVTYADPRNFRGTLWEQNVTGLLPNTTYNFFFYLDNLLPLDDYNTGLINPAIQLRVNGATITTAVVPKLPDRWVRYGNTFTTGPVQNSAVLTVYDNSGNFFGDDFGMTMPTLYRCL